MKDPTIESNMVQRPVTHSSDKGAIQTKTNQQPSIKAKQTPIQAKHKPIQSKQAPLQRKSSSLIQRQKEPSSGEAYNEQPNNTGLPENLKNGIEHLSGYSMDDVKVHYNSDKPIQMNAHAYAQGTDIHLASGQEKHLPHEAWHVVQQKQGRVKPTLQLKDKVDVNDDAGLEKEADIMGAKAQNTQSVKPQNANPATSPANPNGIVQRVIHEHITSTGKKYWVTDLETETTTYYETLEDAKEAERLIIESGKINGRPKRERTAYGSIHFYDKRNHPNGPHTLANVGIDQSIEDIEEQSKIDEYMTEVTEDIEDWKTMAHDAMDEEYRVKYGPGLDHYGKDVEGLRASQELLESEDIPKKLKRRLSDRNLRAAFNLHPLGSFGYGRGGTDEELKGKTERSNAPKNRLFDDGGPGFFNNSEAYQHHEELGTRLLAERKFVKPESAYTSDNSPEARAYRKAQREKNRLRKKRLEQQEKDREKEKEQKRKDSFLSRRERAKKRKKRKDDLFKKPKALTKSDKRSIKKRRRESKGKTKGTKKKKNY
ncbi:hypothetical protein BKI52_08580 [marine bacterium AO1-C]|nr:hypothetical protein BKI52_08580 [marine bacterium AO1-C]